jgi:phosphoribosylamine-glycine ligase
MMGTAPNKDLKNERQVVSAGTCVADVCAIAPTVKEAAKEAYERVRHLEIPNSPIVRDDIGERLEEELPELQKWGYATGWKYG